MLEQGVISVPGCTMYIQQRTVVIATTVAKTLLPRAIHE